MRLETAERSFTRRGRETRAERVWRRQLHGKFSLAARLKPLNLAIRALVDSIIFRNPRL
jgi:hypothetical protein